MERRRNMSGKWLYALNPKPQTLNPKHSWQWNTSRMEDGYASRLGVRRPNEVEMRSSCVLAESAVAASNQLLRHCLPPPSDAMTVAFPWGVLVWMTVFDVCTEAVDAGHHVRLRDDGLDGSITPMSLLQEECEKIKDSYDNVTFGNEGCRMLSTASPVNEGPALRLPPHCSVMTPVKEDQVVEPYPYEESDMVWMMVRDRRERSRDRPWRQHRPRESVRREAYWRPSRDPRIRSPEGPPPTTSTASTRCLGPPGSSTTTTTLGMSILQGIERWRSLLGLRGDAIILPDASVTVMSEADIRTIRETLDGLTPTDQSTMAVAWNTVISVMMMEINREIVESIHVKRYEEPEATTLMQTSMSGGGSDRRGRGRDDDKLPGRPTKKYKRTSRRRSLSSRRRNIDEELSELGVNIAKGGRPIALTCQDTAAKLRHVLGRRSDEAPVGRAGLEKEESDHMLALLARRGDRGALIVAAASFQLIANLALDLATVINLHIVHQEHATRDAKKKDKDADQKGTSR